MGTRLEFLFAVFDFETAVSAGDAFFVEAFLGVAFFCTTGFFVAAFLVDQLHNWAFAGLTVFFHVELSMVAGDNADQTRASSTSSVLEKTETIG